MNLSAFGQRLTSESGTRSLMDDLGAIAAAGGDIMNLGGGNPSLIPAAEMVFRVRLQALMQRDGAFERAIGTYDAPEGDRGFARALAGFLRREQGWDVSERNIALTNGSQSAFIALFNLFAGPGAGEGGASGAPPASSSRSPPSTSGTPMPDSPPECSPRAGRRSPSSATGSSSTGWTSRAWRRQRTSPRSACRGPPTPPATW